jgi:acetyl esterase/lipase
MSDRGLFHVLATTLGLIMSIVMIAFAAVKSGPKPVLDRALGDGGVSSFYVWDKEVPGLPGTLLRQEAIPETLMLANASKGVRVLYTSTNGIDGKTPIAVSGAVYFPKGPTPTGGWQIIAWAHGSTGIADVCAPSWTPHSQRDTDYLNAWLSEGYAIVATDYQGLGTPGGHPWLTVKPEAYSVLDSVRAALKAFPELANSVVIVGQSQGAHAALSATLVAREYAPGLKLKGTVATGVPSASWLMPETKAKQIPVRDPGTWSGRYGVFGLFTYMSIDPVFNPLDYLTDVAKPIFEAGRTTCYADVTATINRNQVTAAKAFKKNPDDAAAKATPYQRYPTPLFSRPVFIGTGLADTTVVPEGQYNLVMAACDAGSTVEAHYYAGKDHSGAVNASLVDSVPFVKKILAGTRIAGNCGAVRPPVPES